MSLCIRNVSVPQRHASALRVVFMALSFILVCSACSTAHLVTSGEEAWKRGNAALALSNWHAARRHELHLLSRRGQEKLESDIADAVGALTRPAMQAAVDAIEAGNGTRSLEILLPLYGRKGLYKYLSSAYLADARERMQPIVGEAIATAAGVNLQALAQGQSAVNSASGRVKDVRRRIERHVRGRPQKALLHLLENVARPAIARGWQLVDGHLAAQRTDDAVGLGQTLASIFPKDGKLRRRLASTRARAAAIHRKKAAQYRGKPGLQWAHLALVARYGGGSNGANAIRNQLRMATFKIDRFAGCGALRSPMYRSIQRGRGGVPVTVSVQVQGCRPHSKQWQTRKRVSWLEWRTRQVKVRETYTAYESQRKCRYVQVYANTTCSTRRTSSTTVRRTCTPNYSTMQRCNNVSVPVQRQRIVTKTQRYQVKLNLMRTIHWYETGFVGNGKVVVTWPGGAREIPFRYSRGVKDHGFNDRAGRRTARRVSIAAFQDEAAKQVAARIHGLHNEVLKPLAAKYRQLAQDAQSAGDPVAAADYGLRGWLVGGPLVGANAASLAKLLVLPPAVAGRPATWLQPKGRLTYRVAKRSTRRRRYKYRSRRRKIQRPLHVPQSLASAIAGGLQTPPEELFNPRLPRPDYRATNLYQQMRPTAFGRKAKGSTAEVRMSASPSVLDAERLGLSMTGVVGAGNGMSLYAGVELRALGLGTTGFLVGAETPAGDARDGLFFGLRYRYHELVAAEGIAAGGISSNLDVYFKYQGSGDYGVWGEAALNAAAWLGDEDRAHYHPVAAGVFAKYGLLVARAGAIYHVGAGAARWFGGVGIRF